jgi:hypothetical protein
LSIIITAFKSRKNAAECANVSRTKSKLRRAQSWVLENVSGDLPVHEAAVAFRPGISTAQNAARHAGKGWLFASTLKDFFPSIGFARVKRFFQSLGYNEGCARFSPALHEAPRVELSLDGQKRHVAIGDRVLPQGAALRPRSPICCVAASMRA